jgi:hypothetical protein
MQAQPVASAVTSIADGDSPTEQLIEVLDRTCCELEDTVPVRARLDVELDVVLLELQALTDLMERIP